MPNTQITPFTFEGLKVRTVDIDGVPWFVAKDVCEILGIQNPSKTLENFPENERNTLTSSEGIHEGPGNPNVNIVNEPGLYRLIFQSRKPEAEAFKTWVFTEVLPAVRKDGYYRLRSQYEKQLLMQRLPPLESPQGGGYRYKFFELPNAKMILDSLADMAARNLINGSDILTLIMGSTEKQAQKSVRDNALKTFIKENIIMTDSKDDYMIIEEAYKRYINSTMFYKEISRHSFTRAIRKTFDYGILEWVKRICGVPTRVFVFCKLKEEVVNA